MSARLGSRRQGGGDSTPGSDGGAITRLFPKCRPRARRSHPAMHHNDRSSPTLDSRRNEFNTMNNLSSDDERSREGDPDLILNSKGGSYKLRDSRIIEIAGGRELYSASRSKAARKLRQSASHKHARHRQRALPDEYAPNDSTIQRMTNHDTRKMVSKQTSPAHVNGGRSLYKNGTLSPEAPSPSPEPRASQKGSPIAVVADGQVVVLDDISQDWKSLRLNLDCSDAEGDASGRGERAPSEAGGARPARVIGELPIAEYEGSPRRYGVAVTPARSPRPGFPQRVMDESVCDEDKTRASSSAAFDYLYEFSETRKVLEEFFRGPTGAAAQQPGEEILNLQDLEYSLIRQPCSPEPVSPDAGWRARRAPPPKRFRDDSPAGNVIAMQQLDPYERELNVVELSVGTDSGSRAGEDGPGDEQHAPHFALSPDTTDCDSNCGDLDSELSLGVVENDIEKGLSEIPRSLTDRISIPAVEDGLSSGHASDNDNNNLHTLSTLQLMQTRNSSAQPVSVDKELEVVTEDDLLVHSDLHSLDPLAPSEVSPPPPAPAPHRLPHQSVSQLHHSVWPPGKRANSAASTESVERKPISGDEDEADTDLETDRLLGQQRTDDQGFFDDKGWRKPKSRTVMPPGCPTASVVPVAGTQPPDADNNTIGSTKDKDAKKKGKNKEDGTGNPSVLIEGVLFRARYLGSTQLACEGQPTKATRMLQAEEAVSRIKAPEGESQPSTEVDLFISTEKIMVLNTELKEIMMDHALRTISYIADIGELVVLMARRRFVPHDGDAEPPKLHRTPKMICHVFESEEAQFIAQSIGQAFQVAYMEFLKANGIEDHSFVKEMDYQEVLNSQEIFGDELQMFAKKELQKEVVVPKAKGEMLGVVVVESGWGSMLPTVVIANLAPAGAAARCSHLNIGDQIIAINGVSLVGLPLSTCQNYIKNSKNQTVVKLTVVPCPPVVEVKIKRPDTKYQLGFSVQNGVICSLLRGGIAERGGVRVGHRIIEINSQSVVAVPHERIVNLLATSVGEILMKTMPTSMFRLLTGQENPVYI